MRKMLLACLALALMPVPAFAGTPAQEADARAHGYANYESYYCHIFGTWTNGKTCPASAFAKPERPRRKLSKSQSCEYAFNVCWNARARLKDYAGANACGIQRSQCLERLGVQRR